MPQLEGPGIERADRTTRTIPEWLKDWRVEERAKLAGTIADPIQRRMKEIELDTEADRLEREIMEAV